MTFQLDARLASDTHVVGDLGLSRVLLMRDARFPWLILVPRREGLSELGDLDAGERAALMEEIARAGDALRGFERIEKINVGALGNIVRQLHVHVVGRRGGDAAWPGPVWGSGRAIPYENKAAEALVMRFAAQLRVARGEASREL